MMLVDSCWLVGDDAWHDACLPGTPEALGAEPVDPAFVLPGDATMFCAGCGLPVT